MHVYESEGNVRELVVFFHHAGPEHQILLLGIARQCLYLLSHLVVWILSSQCSGVTPNRTRDTLRSATGNVTTFL